MSLQNILQFYSTTFFHSPNHPSTSLLGPSVSLGFGLANFIFTFPVYHSIDKRGRRFLLLSSYPGMILSMLGASLAYNIKDETRQLVVVVLFMFLFVFFYSWGQGPVPFAYSSEVFLLLNREAGMSFAVFANLFGAGTFLPLHPHHITTSTYPSSHLFFFNVNDVRILGLLALIVPHLTLTLSPTTTTSPPSPIPNISTGESRLLAIFTALNTLAFLLIFFLVPETAGATLGSSTTGLNYISLEELN
jgi:MFS family permease